MEEKKATEGPTSGSPPGVRTFLIADLRGYTRFTDEQGDEAAARLTSGFLSLARDAVSARSGEVVEVRGDEVLAVFDSPREAERIDLCPGVLLNLIPTTTCSTRWRTRGRKRHSPTPTGSPSRRGSPRSATFGPIADTIGKTGRRSP